MLRIVRSAPGSCISGQGLNEGSMLRASISCGSRAITLRIASGRLSSLCSTFNTLNSPGSRRSVGAGSLRPAAAYCERYVPKATRVIVPNEAGLEQLLRHFPLKRERVLLLPHPTSTWALEAAEKNPASSSLSIDDLRDPFLLYPAQFWSHKNHVTLLRALAEVNRRRSDRRFQLVCVGTDKGGRARVEHLVDELSLREDVIFSGFVELDQLVALYRRAYALVFLSWFGPENLPPLEAFALGCPVIYADVPGAREQAGNAALLVPPDQPEQVADAILSLEDDDVRSQLIEAGRERARKNSVDQYVGGVIEFLDQFEAVRSCWS